MLLLYLLYLAVHSRTFQIEQAKAQGHATDGNHLQQPLSRNMRAASAKFKKESAVSRNQSDFLGAPGAYFAQLFLTEIGSSAPSGGPILVQFWFLQCLALTSFMGLAIWIFNVARFISAYRFHYLRFSRIMKSDNLRYRFPELRWPSTPC